MAQREDDIDRNNIMADVVYISDDDERDDGPPGEDRRAPAEDRLQHSDGSYYVLDDVEEESLLIDPIRKKSFAIIFGSCLKPPTEFPYELLLEINAHVEKNLQDGTNLSVTTERNVWEYVLEQLSVMRIAYSKHIDVRTNIH